MKPLIGALKSENGDSFFDRKARAFLVLAPHFGDKGANAIIAMLLDAGLQIVGEEQKRENL